MKDLVISSNQDQMIRMDVTDMEKTDLLVNQSILDGDPDEALSVVAQIIKQIHKGSMYVSRIFWLMNKRWQEYGIEGDFKDYAFEAVGLSTITINNYLSIWNMLEHPEFPTEIKDKIIQSNNSNQLTSISRVFLSGYKIENDQWNMLIKAENATETLSVIRQIKGVAPKAGSITLGLDKTGRITAWSDGESYYIGQLNLEEALKEDVVAHAINRIVTHTGILMEGI